MRITSKTKNTLNNTLLALRAVLLAAVFLILCSCATTNNTKKDPIEQAMDDAIGIMTYDDAVKRLGEPTTVVQGSDFFSAAWVDEVDTAREDPAIVYIIKPDYKTEILTLEFDSDTKKLLRWKHEKLP